MSVGGFCAADYAETCAVLGGVEAIELNLSCPNVDEAADSAAEIVAACRRETSLPLYAKLSAAHPDVTEVARAVAAAGADGLSLINTLRGMALHPRTLQPVLAARAGRPLGTVAQAGRARRRFTRATPPRSCRSSAWAEWRPGSDALEFAAVGARDVALGTVLFWDPDAPARVRSELATLDADEAFASAHGPSHVLA